VGRACGDGVIGPPTLVPVRRLTPLVVAAAVLWPSAALAASPSPSPVTFSAGEEAAVHVLSQARVYTDTKAVAGRMVLPAKLRKEIGDAKIRVAVMPATTTAGGESASSIADRLLAGTKLDEQVLFVLVGREFGAAAGSKALISGDQARTIAHQTFAAHSAAGFTPDNVERVLELSIDQAKQALAAAALNPSPPAASEVDNSTSTESKSPPAGLVIAAAVIVVLIVVTVAVMSWLSRRQGEHGAALPHAVSPEVPHEPVVDLADRPTGTEPVDLGALADPTEPLAALGVPVAPEFAWTGGAWPQADPTDG